VIFEPETMQQAVQNAFRRRGRIPAR
jgi:hypothetical protein